MAQFGLEKYCIVDTQLCDEKLIEIFDQINDNLDDISQRQSEVAVQMYQIVREDFAQMIRSTLDCVMGQDVRPRPFITGKTLTRHGRRAFY